MRNRYSVLALAGLLAVGGCPGGSEPPVPVATTVQVSPSAAINFSSIGATHQLSGAVLDQSGDTMPGLNVTWSSGNNAVAMVNAGGLVTAVGNGTTTITAASGSITGTIGVTVAQVATLLSKNGGDNQTWTVALQAPQALQVRVTDANSNPIAGVTVTFAIATGSGSLGSPSATTNAQGVATSTWTLGQTAGTQTVNATATVPAGTLGPVTFTATATAGNPAGISIQAGNNQTATINTDVAVDPQVRVVDSFNNPKSGASVTFAVTGGGGSITPASGVVTTDNSGNATLGAWTMGGAAGPNSMTATITGVGASTTFNATAVLPGAPANIAVFVGNNQTGAVGSATNIRPAVRVTDSNGGPVAGVAVTFAVGSGGGSITGNPVVNTNANGVAQVGAWVLGAGAGANSLTATAAPAGITNNPITFNATGITPAFNIVVRFLTTVTPAQQAAFNNAAARWAQIIIGDLPDFVLNQAAGNCFAGSPAHNNETIDDVVIYASVEPIDGAGGVLGSAGPCGGTGNLRTIPGGFMVVWGRMRFDDADLINLENSGRLEAVILHEMGHVLGVGTIWGANNVLVNTATAPGGDAHFTGVNGRAAFDSIGGLSYTGNPGFQPNGLKVPVENQFGPGTADGHWRESVFDEELMTGFVEAGGTAMPISLMTAASLQDIGYVVSFAASEPLTQTYSIRAAFTGPSPNIGHDVAEPIGFITTIDRAGRVTRTRAPK